METLPLLTALIAGFVHALEPDHMAAVTTFVSRRPRPLEALGFGVRWGVGHSAAILVVGFALIALGVHDRVPATVVHGLEFGVGVMLTGLGLGLLWSVVHGRAHALADPQPPHPHRHGSAWVGMAHGLAGTAPLVAVVGASMSASPWIAGTYLLLFGVGTTAGMALYALAAGALFGRAEHRAPRVGSALRTLTALGSAVLGVFWMVNAMV